MIQPFLRYISTSNSRCPSLLIPGFTRDHGAQLHHVDDELEAVAEDEDTDDDDQDGPHHQVALLTLAQAAQPLRPGPGNM